MSRLPTRQNFGPSPRCRHNSNADELQRRYAAASLVVKPRLGSFAILLSIPLASEGIDTYSCSLAQAIYSFYFQLLTLPCAQFGRVGITRLAIYAYSHGIYGLLHDRAVAAEIGVHKKHFSAGCQLNGFRSPGGDRCFPKTAQ